MRNMRADEPVERSTNGSATTNSAASPQSAQPSHCSDAGKSATNVSGVRRYHGVGNVSGPIVLGHDVLDGSPLQLHWLIVNLRSFDSDGLGACQLRGRVQVCAAEPAKGATSCGTLQHAGIIHIEPQADDPPP